MNPDTWKLVASIGGVLITAVTGPIIWAMRAEAGKLRTEMKLLEAQIKLEMSEMEKRTEGQFSKIIIALTETESRLNARIDTRLVHR